MAAAGCQGILIWGPSSQQLWGLCNTAFHQRGTGSMAGSQGMSQHWCSPGCVSTGLKVEKTAVAAGCPQALELPSRLCFCTAEFPCFSLVMEYLESLFTVVWDAFAPLEHLGVSSSSAITQAGVYLSPVKGQMRVWPVPAAL